MATICQVITGNATGNNALILDPRERLIYPFNIPNYNEIRVGMFFSFVGVTGGNNSMVTDDQVTIFGQSTRMFWGLCNADTGVLVYPGTSGGFDFFGEVLGLNGGLARNDTTSIAVFCQPGINQNGRYAVYDATGAAFSDSVTPTTTYCPITTGGSGAFWGFQYMLNPNNSYSGLVFTYGSATPFLDTSIPNLRTQINTRGTAYGSYSTGWWTSGRSPGASAMQRPNSLYIYNPMLNSRMRIHALAVEKYA